jgi:REP-associated tyrosine transposase
VRPGGKPIARQQGRRDRIPTQFCPRSFVFLHSDFAERRSRLLIDNIELLRAAFRTTLRRHPFTIDAIAVLPDHRHAIWTLPEGDSNFAVRWQLIKGGFSRSLPRGEPASASRLGRREREIWQRRYWGHTLRNDDDFARHSDYIHLNPIKHGLVERVRDWPFSSYHRMVRLGVYPKDWAGAAESSNGSFGER